MSYKPELLVVDDDPDYIDLFKVKAESLFKDYPIYYAGSGAEALKILDEHKEIDIILCDILMEGYDGIELLAKIRTLDPIKQVIMVSADGNLKTIRKAMNCGAFDFIVKPLDYDDLRATINKTINHITELHTNRDELEKSYKHLQRVMNQTINAVSYICEIKDPYTAGHQRRVATIAKSIGEQMNLGRFRNEGIYIAGVLHDVGKIGIPSELLSRPGRLNENELTLIKDHAQAGYEILKDIDFPWPIAEHVWMHHEKLNGTGYPRQLSGNQIPLEARILTVADVFESVFSFRPYRPGLGMEKAISVLTEGSGVEFDPEIVDICKYVVKHYVDAA